ncbi:MAG TPA: hypothetical protein VMV17_05120 [Streptosporangiaceae bacterium]|nr:hypothetical protein [Streptosporangiaceae bacterium]
MRPQAVRRGLFSQSVQAVSVQDEVRRSSCGHARAIPGLIERGDRIFPDFGLDRTRLGVPPIKKIPQRCQPTQTLDVLG